MKNQGISLISLIITIIVIIILAAIVIFSGLGTPDSANLAAFTKQCENVSDAVLNRYALLYEHHSLNQEPRTQEQIYMEIADGVEFSGDTARGQSMGATQCRNIDADAATAAVTEDNRAPLNMTLPQVNHKNDAWYVTKDGKIFNTTGFPYDGKTYFNGSTYQVGDSSSVTSENIGTLAAAVIAGDTVVSFGNN